MVKLLYRYTYYKGDWDDAGGIKISSAITEWVDVSPFQFKEKFGFKYKTFKVRTEYELSEHKDNSEE